MNVKVKVLCRSAELDETNTQCAYALHEYNDSGKEIVVGARPVIVVRDRPGTCIIGSKYELIVTLVEVKK